MSVISRPKQQAVCVYVCVPAWVCVCIFFPPYGCDLVICYSMLAYSHTSGFAPLCGFLVCVDKVFSGSGQHLVCVFFFFVLFFFFSSPWSSHQAYYPLYPSCLVLSLWQTVPDLISCSILSLIGRSILLNVGVSASPDVNMLRGTEVKRGHR